MPYIYTIINESQGHIWASFVGKVLTQEYMQTDSDYYNKLWNILNVDTQGPG